MVTVVGSATLTQILNQIVGTLIMQSIVLNLDMTTGLEEGNLWI